MREIADLMLDSLVTSSAFAFTLAAVGAGGLAVAFVVANLVHARSDQAERDFITARQRLPAAARLEHVDHLLREREKELSDLDGRLGRVRQEVAEAERAKLDAEQWRDLAEQAKRDYEALSEERQEVDRVRTEHEQVLVDLGQARSDLETTRHERVRLTDEVRALGDQVRALEDKHYEFTELETKIEERQKTIAELRTELEQLQDRRNEVAAAKFELDEGHRRLAALEERLTRITNEIVGLAERRKILEAELSPVENRREALAREIDERSRVVDELAERRDSLEADVRTLRERLAGLEERRAGIADDVDQLSKRRNTLKEELQTLDELQVARNRLRHEIEERTHTLEDLSARRSSLEAVVSSLQERETALRERVGELKGKSPGAASAAPPVDRGEVVADLIRHPAALFDEQRSRLLSSSQASHDERAALDRVQEHLKALRLHFDPRIVKRFHTCLKTARISPLTVLAGISGTGKSQLPQRYAEAMGMHFLKIAVQPRWDSPQDLFGFYNYLEQKYRATELARSLIYMDPLGNSLIEPAQSMKNRMLLVLLDEMNLARVEYYFSDFLSRLEGRPAPGVENKEHVRPAQIEIELGIEAEPRPTVYPGHNVLFTGTMNEDESTQSLSDKVLDRANVMRFSRPRQLVGEIQGHGGRFADAYLPFDTWVQWHVSLDKIRSEVLNSAEGFLRELNDQLGQLRRPFGFRIYQAILSYVANHPDAGTSGGWQSALSDMLELRVLPKLRGMEIEDRFRPPLRRLEQLVRDQLKHESLAATISAAAQQSDTFDWVPPG